MSISLAMTTIIPFADEESFEGTTGGVGSLEELYRSGASEHHGALS